MEESFIVDSFLFISLYRNVGGYYFIPQSVEEDEFWLLKSLNEKQQLLIGTEFIDVFKFEKCMMM